MVKLSEIRALIDAYIKTNGNQQITGHTMNVVLNEIVRILDERKQDVLVSGENIKTIGGMSLLGEGDIPGYDDTEIRNLINAVVTAVEGQNGKIAEVAESVQEQGKKLTELSDEVSGLSEDAAKIDDITSAIKSNNINSAKIELGGYSAIYDQGIVREWASTTITRCDSPIYFEQGKSIYMILENAPMQYITVIPIDADGKPVGTANVLLYATNMSTTGVVFTPPSGAVALLFYAQSQGNIDYKLGLYYTDYKTSVVEEYKPDQVAVDANKLAKDGKMVVFAEKKEFDANQERLEIDKVISKELPTIDNPDVEYSKHLISAVRQEISEMWRWISNKEVTILDSGVCGPTLYWELHSDGLLRIFGEGEAYNYCKGLLMDELVGDDYDSLPNMRSKIEKYQSNYIGLTDENSVAKYERGFQEGKIYDDEHEQYFAPWYIYRPEQDFTEYGGGYSSKANYDMHNPNGWQYNRIIIDEGVTYLGNWMLYRLCGVSELVIPSSVKGIGQWCIRYSPSLKCVYLPDGIETVEKHGCSRLEVCEAIRLGEGFTRVEDFAFMQNAKVKSLCLSGNIDFVGIKPFSYNSELSDVTIKGVESIDVWFTECNNLRRVQLSEGLVTIKPSAFVTKRNLSVINIPSTVENIGQSAFYECPNLRVVYLDSPTIAANVVNYTGTESADFLITNVKYLYINSKITNISAWILENFTKVNDADGYALYVRN